MYFFKIYSFALVCFNSLHCATLSFFEACYEKQEILKSVNHLFSKQVRLFSRDYLSRVQNTEGGKKGSNGASSVRHILNGYPQHFYF